MPLEIVAQVDPVSSRVVGRGERGPAIELDADPPEGSGELPGPREALLISLAGCTAMDVASILRKKRQTATTYEIGIRGETAEEHPRVFTAISVEHRVSGDVAAEALRRSIELSATRYCPVNAMLSAVARIEHRYRLEGSDGAVAEAIVTVTGPDGAAPGHEAFRSS